MPVKLSSTLSEEVARLYVQEKLTGKLIAERLQIDTGTVFRVLKDAGIKRRQTRDRVDELAPRILALRKAGASICHICREVGLGRQAVYRVVGNDNASTEQWDADAIVLKYQNGQSVSSLAREYHVANSTIRKIFERRSIPIRNKRAGIQMKLDQDAAQVSLNGFVHFSPKMYKSWMRNAASRGIEWSITPPHLERVYEEQCGKCYYSGLPMFVTNLNRVHRRNINRIDLISLDRKDSEKGYSPENVVLCCVSMNYAKSDWPVDVFRAFLQQAASNIILGQTPAEEAASTFSALTNQPA